MPVYAVQLAPQRSTQYSELVRQLAPHELRLSPVGQRTSGEIEAVRLGSVDYLCFTLDSPLDDDLRAELARLAMIDAAFAYYDRVGDVDGPLLRPLDLPDAALFPASLVATRRYRGKTNELFTGFLCNIARHSSAYHATPWHKLTLLDPLAGGGTTLFAGLMLGADVAGVERDKKVVEGTVAFLRQYAKEGRIPAQFREDRLKTVGKRWFITLHESVRCVIGHGDTADVAHFVHGLKTPQLIVTDLPYGIQHRAAWQAMLHEALPAWADVLAADGVLAFAWDATRFSRTEMVALVEATSPFRVRDEAPYDGLAHRVDRVIKRRDVIIAHKI